MESGGGDIPNDISLILSEFDSFLDTLFGSSVDSKEEGQVSLLKVADPFAFDPNAHSGSAESLVEEDGPKKCLPGCATVENRQNDEVDANVGGLENQQRDSNVGNLQSQQVDSNVGNSKIQPVDSKVENSKIQPVDSKFENSKIQQVDSKFENSKIQQVDSKFENSKNQQVSSDGSSDERRWKGIKMSPFSKSADEGNNQSPSIFSPKKVGSEKLSAVSLNIPRPSLSSNKKSHLCLWKNEKISPIVKDQIVKYDDVLGELQRSLARENETDASAESYKRKCQEDAGSINRGWKLFKRRTCQKCSSKSNSQKHPNFEGIFTEHSLVLERSNDYLYDEEGRELYDGERGELYDGERGDQSLFSLTSKIAAGIMCAEHRGTKALELWSRRVTQEYDGVAVLNMTTSWRDGLAFCALIHHFRPDLLDFKSLKPGNILENNSLAYRVAEQHLGIPALLDAEDMVLTEVPDRLSILTYVSQFYQAFSAQGLIGPGGRRSPTSENNAKNISLSSTPSSKTVPVPVPSSDKSPSVPTAPKSPAIIPQKSPVLPPPLTALSKAKPISQPPATLQTKTETEFKTDKVTVGVRPRREVCTTCSKPVFLAERLLIGSPGQLRHRTCFRCDRCSAQLTLASYYETEKGKFCCEMCPDEEKDICGAEGAELKEPTSLPLEDPHSSSDTESGSTSDESSSVTKSNPSSLETTAETKSIPSDSLPPPKPARSKVPHADGSSSRSPQLAENEKQEPHSASEQTQTENTSLYSIQSHQNSAMVEPKPIEIVSEETPLEDHVDSHVRNSKSPSQTIPSEESLNGSNSLLVANVPQLPDLEKPSLGNDEIIRVSLNTPANIVVESDSKVDGPNPPGDVSNATQEKKLASTEELNPFMEDDETAAEKMAVSEEASRKEPLNPFDSDGEDEEKKMKNTLNPFWSDDEEEGTSWSKGKKKPPRPPPPTLRRDTTPTRKFLPPYAGWVTPPSPSLSSSSSDQSNLHLMRRSKRPAPMPPNALSPTSPRFPGSRGVRDEDEAVSKKWQKDFQNQTNKILLASSTAANARSLLKNEKSEYGEWQRKKGPAPPRPVPRKRVIKKLPMKYVQQELDDIEVKQTELERQGVLLEMAIREKTEVESGSSSAGDGREASSFDGEKSDLSLASTASTGSQNVEVEDMILHLFELVNEKNELFRRQTELMYMKREKRLEEDYVELEFQIRCLMLKSPSEKSQMDLEHEEELIRRLVKVVEQRDEVVNCLEMERQREALEDESIASHLIKYRERHIEGIESDEDNVSSKKKKKKKRLHLLKKKKKSKDADKDVDEVELKERKKKKKWFKTKSLAS